MVGPSVVVDENVVEENENSFRNKGRKMLFIRAWNVVGALVRPNGITKNS